MISITYYENIILIISGVLVLITILSNLATKYTEKRAVGEKISSDWIKISSYDVLFNKYLHNIIETENNNNNFTYNLLEINNVHKMNNCFYKGDVSFFKKNKQNFFTWFSREKVETIEKKKVWIELNNFKIKKYNINAL